MKNIKNWEQFNEGIWDAKKRCPSCGSELVGNNCDYCVDKKEEPKRITDPKNLFDYLWEPPRRARKSREDTIKNSEKEQIAWPTEYKFELQKLIKVLTSCRTDSQLAYAIDYFRLWKEKWSKFLSSNKSYYHKYILNWFNYDSERIDKWIKNEEEDFNRLRTIKIK